MGINQDIVRSSEQVENKWFKIIGVESKWLEEEQEGI